MKQNFNKALKTIKSKLAIVLTLALVLAATFSYTVFATTPNPTIDESVFTTIVNGAKAVLGLFTIFPINIFLAASILGIAVGVIRKVKSSS